MEKGRRMRSISIFSAVILIASVAILTGCGDKNVSMNKNEDASSKTVQELTTEDETDEDEGEEGVISDEMGKLYEKYGGCSIKERIPKIGDQVDFAFEDVVTEVEDIITDQYGTYVFIRFTHPENNVIVFDDSRQRNGEADYKKLKQKQEEERLSGQSGYVHMDNIPQVGETARSYKDRVITEVEDLNLIDDKGRPLYLVKEEGGQECLVAVIGGMGGKYATLDFVPRKGQTAGFEFEDTVVSTEDIGPHSMGMYVVIHFQDAKHDLLVQDESRKGEDNTVPGEADAKYEELNQAWGQNSIGTLPEVGSSVRMIKNTEVANVTEAEETDGNGQCFIMESVDGITNTVYVRNENIPSSSFELYECGIYDGSVYQNDFYGLQIALPAENGWVPYGEDIQDCRTEILNTQVTMFYEYLFLPEGGHVNFYTYEFIDTVTEEQFTQFMEEQYSGMREEGTQDIVGKEYRKARHQTEYDGNCAEEPVILYRMDGNKIYVIKITIPDYLSESCTYESICETFKEYGN